MEDYIDYSGLKNVTIYNGDGLSDSVFNRCQNIENIIIHSMKKYISDIFNYTNVKTVEGAYP